MRQRADVHGIRRCWQPGTELNRVAWCRRFRAKNRAAGAATAVTVLSLVINRAFSTPSVRAATLTEAAMAAVFPAATPAAASAVAAASPGAGEAMHSDSRTADSAAGQTMPRPFRRRPRASRASSNRRRSVLLLQASWLAASSCVRPSR